MTQPPKPTQKIAQKATGKGSDSKMLLSTLRMTTAVGAVGLTLAGWGLLARADAFAATQGTQDATAGFTGSAAGLVAASAAATPEQVATAGFTGSGAGLVAASATATPKQFAAAVENAAANRATEGSEVEDHDELESDQGERESDHGGALTQSRKVASVFLPTATAAPAATATTAAIAAPAATATNAATAAPAATAVAAATATDLAPTATATPVTKFKLNVVQWVSTQAGDPVAVVQDNRGVLWYVWGPDVTRIEQGLNPQYPPQAVNAVSRSRAS